MLGAPRFSRRVHVEAHLHPVVLLLDQPNQRAQPLDLLAIPIFVGAQFGQLLLLQLVLVGAVLDILQQLAVLFAELVVAVGHLLLGFLIGGFGEVWIGLVGADGAGWGVG